MLAAGERTPGSATTPTRCCSRWPRSVFAWAVRWATTLPHVSHVVLVIRDGDQDSVRSALARGLPDTAVTVVTGGSSRHESEWKALCALRPAIEGGETDVVVIHDAARPSRVRRAVPRRDRGGGAVRRRAAGDRAAGARTAARRGRAGHRPHRRGADPQAFRAEPLLAAYTAAEREGFVGTDTASFVERYTDVPVHSRRHRRRAQHQDHLPRGPVPGRAAARRPSGNFRAGTGAAPPTTGPR